MARYDYVCEKCGEAITHTFKIGEAPDTASCPKCKGDMYRDWTCSYIIKGTNGGSTPRCGV